VTGRRRLDPSSILVPQAAIQPAGSAVGAGGGHRRHAETAPVRTAAGGGLVIAASALRPASAASAAPSSRVKRPDMGEGDEPWTVGLLEDAQPLRLGDVPAVAGQDLARHGGAGSTVARSSARASPVTKRRPQAVHHW
jgi:hypothetical protein